MSDTKKAGKHPGRNIKNPPKPDGDAKLLEPILSRHTYGSTEKILRRNRKTWTRLLNKRRRALDKKKIEENEMS